MGLRQDALATHERFQTPTSLSYVALPPRVTVKVPPVVLCAEACKYYCFKLDRDCTHLVTTILQWSQPENYRLLSQLEGSLLLSGKLPNAPGLQAPLLDTK